MTLSSDFISIRGVEKYFGNFCAIENVSMDIRQGEFFSLLGASGCGKTTLLRTLAGLEGVSSGEIWIDGQEMSDVPPYRRPVNMVFQNYAIFPHINVADNVGYGLRKLKLPALERKNRIDEMLELVQLSGYGNRKSNELSGGQRQRVALARALILKPKVLLLDEPLGALDKQLREQMQLELRRLQRSVGITFVFVTHDQEEALTLSDRIAVMADGRVLQIDTPAGLYERPLSRKVASFVGNMNFLDAKVASRANGHARLDVQGLGNLQLPVIGQALDKGASTCIAVRPEKLELHDVSPGTGKRAIEVVLEMTAYLGERIHYHVRVPGCDKPISVSAPNTAANQQRGKNPGSPLWMTWPDEALILLERD